MMQFGLASSYTVASTRRANHARVLALGPRYDLLSNLYSQYVAEPCFQANPPRALLGASLCFIAKLQI